MNYKGYENYKGYSSYKGYEDYKKLDVTKESASKEELEKLKEKNKENKEYVVNIRGMLLCLGISFILTVAIIILYGHVIKLSIDFILGMFIPYFGILLIIATSIYLIIQKINKKWYVCVAMLGLDTLILTTSLLIANIVPISGTLQIIMSIIGIITAILFVLLIYMVAKFEPKK